MLGTMRPKFCLALLFLLALVSAQADTQFRVRKMTRGDVPTGRGQCDIWIYVDNEIEVSVRGDMVFARTISGREARDGGSECNEPLPAHDVRGFRYEEADSRAEMRLVSEPNRGNGYQAVVRIRDGAPGECHCHFRLTWEMGGGGDISRHDSDDFPGRRHDDDADQRGGLAWNNTTHFGGRGEGSSTLTGYGTQRLFDASVDIDRGNRIFVSFRTDSGRALTFSGSVLEGDRDKLKADVATEDGARLRGSMFVSRNPRGDVDRITLEATNGQDRLSLNWDRRR